MITIIIIRIRRRIVFGDHGKIRVTITFDYDADFWARA